MRKTEFVFLLLILGILGWTSHFIQQEPARPRELLAPPASIQYFTFGHRDLVADMLWVRSIQDFDYCEKKQTENLCRGNSWLYQMLNVITDLSPDFRMAYSAGAMALTVIISDIEGASKFFDKAVAHFPNDWLILFKAAYQAQYEEKNPAKAASLLERAGQNGAPDWVFALAGRLYSRTGENDLALALARQLEASGGDERIINAIRERARGQ